MKRKIIKTDSENATDSNLCEAKSKRWKKALQSGGEFIPWQIVTITAYGRITE